MQFETAHAGTSMPYAPITGHDMQRIVSDLHEIVPAANFCMAYGDTDSRQTRNGGHPEGVEW